MPVVSIGRDRLFERLGRTYTEEEFEELCFEFGIELDDVTTENERIRKEHHEGDAPIAAPAEDEEVIYRIDIPANRYDLLCIEGLARALNIFRGKAPSPVFTLADMAGKEMQKIVVKPETTLVRPFVVCAVLRGVTFDKARYNSFIDLQDKLHQNLCRRRTLVAIGTHDLDRIQGPFTYEAVPPEDIKFVPLKQTQEFDAKGLFDFYRSDPNSLQLKKFLPIIEDSLVYPVIYDAKRTVLSLPPIINGSHSAISLETRNVFIECTATDLTKAKIVLNTVVTMFSEYCERPFEIEPVEVVDALGQSAVYPDLMQDRQVTTDTDFINSRAGINLDADKACELLNRMQLPATGSGKQITVTIPPTRSDVLHACDVMEDVAIAYGFNNIAKTTPKERTVGKEQPLNALSDHVRAEVAMAGFTEVLTWALCSHDESFDFLNREDDGKTAVVIGNPATVEFQVCRTSLLSGALKTLGANKDCALPIKIFEVSDVVLLDGAKDVGARNCRRLVALYCNQSTGFEIIHGLMDRVMEVMGVPAAGGEVNKIQARLGGGYEIKESSDPTFFPGRQAELFIKGQRVGVFGVVHPEVLEKFEIPYPCSALEIDLEPFVYNQMYKSLLPEDPYLPETK